MQKPSLSKTQRRNQLMQMLKEMPPESRRKVIAQVKAAAERPKGPIKTKG